MQITKMRIDGQIFFVSPSQDVSELKEQIVSASRQGPAFVDFETMGHGAVSVLVTPYQTARFETVERTDQELASWDETPPPFDVDSYVD